MEKILTDILNNCPSSVKDYMNSKRYQANEIIISQGEIPDYVHIIQKGRVKVYYTSAKGKTYLKCYLGVGDILGDMEILTSKPYTSFVETVEECAIIYFPKFVYLNWLKKDHDFSLYIIQNLSRKLYHSSVNSNLNVYPLKYGLLKKLYHLYGKNNNNPELTISKADLADNLGSSVRSINRILKDLSNDNIIDGSKNKISILSIAGIIREIGNYDKS